MTFDDGVSGPYDLSEFIGRGPYFEPLRDGAYFSTVAVASDGRSFGWNLDEFGKEIDFCPDATRIAIETALVEELAERYARRLAAAQ